MDNRGSIVAKRAKVRKWSVRATKEFKMSRAILISGQVQTGMLL